tara:strand:+ start:1225 stop:1569 length:345 start_codon:yes stop_codon:yes gene_type:complete
MAEKNTTLKDLIKDIDFRLTHLEDMEYDNRKLMIKLVKQGNTIVEFLKQLEVTEPPSLEEELFPRKEPLVSADKIATIRELVDEFMDKAADLKEFEEELQKHKDKITPGQVGES